MTPRVKRYVWIAIGIGVALFAIQGGQYSTLDLFRQHARREYLIDRVDQLQRDVDSLTILAHLLATDPATQERVAREEFGMVRGNELLYRFAPAPVPSR